MHVYLHVESENNVFSSVLALAAAISMGVTNPDVTQDTIQSTICKPGWTKTIRPSSYYTNALKRKQMRERHIILPMREVEENHIIPLELGGSKDDPANLEPEIMAGKYGAKAHDKIENKLNRKVCRGEMTLAQARIEIVTDWQKYVR